VWLALKVNAVILWALCLRYLILSYRVCHWLRSKMKHFIQPLRVGAVLYTWTDNIWVRSVALNLASNVKWTLKSLNLMLVHQASFQTSATALRQQLHWLPIRQRITYKQATLTFKAKYCRTPLYLHEQLRDHQFARALRSTTAPLFYRPLVSTVFASRTFYYSAPQVWNYLRTSTWLANTFNSFRPC